MTLRRARTGLLLVALALTALYLGSTWFLGYLVLLCGISLVAVKIRHDRLSRSRVDMELERAHHQDTEYDWRPWAKPDYREHRRR